MINQIGRFKADSNGVIHITSKEDEIEIMSEIDSMSTKMWKDLPLVNLEYKTDKKGDR